jgi:hypothetical protein
MSDCKTVLSRSVGETHVFGRLRRNITWVTPVLRRLVLRATKQACFGQIRCFATGLTRRNLRLKDYVRATPPFAGGREARYC